MGFGFSESCMAQAAVQNVLDFGSLGQDGAGGQQPNKP